MRKLLEHCPACDGELIVSQMSCTRCNTAVIGSFQPNIFTKLSAESLKFLETFVKNKGNVKEMERETGMSYWTIRTRLNDVIAELGFEAKADEEEEAALKVQQRQEILDRLEQDEISVDEAMKLMDKLQG